MFFSVQANGDILVSIVSEAGKGSVPYARVHRGSRKVLAVATWTVSGRQGAVALSAEQLTLSSASAPTRLRSAPVSSPRALPALRLR